jgi:hypothetical protein
VAVAPPEPAAAEPEGSMIDQRVTQHFATSTQSPGSALPFKRRNGAGPEAVARTNAEGIRLLATQMAVAGSSREDIEARLSSEFGVDDATEVLAEVLRPRDLTQRVAG